METSISHFISDVFPQMRVLEMPASQMPLLLEKEFVFSTSKNPDSFLFAEAKRYLSAGEILRFFNLIRQAIKPSKILVFLLKTLSSHDKALLLDSHIPFLSADGEVYIPFHEVRLQSLSRRPPLSYDLVAQNLALAYFALPYGFYDLKALAAYLPFQPSRISEANRCLFSLGLLEKEGKETRVKYARVKDKSTYLSSLMPLLISPLYGRFYMEKSPNQNRIRNSEESLGFYTDILPQEQGFCLDKKEFKQASPSFYLKPRERLPHVDYDEVDVFVYRPLFPVQSHLNPLDVLAVYKEDPDERVQTALSHIIEDLIHDRIGQI
jgi:hypothetical protein